MCLQNEEGGLEGEGNSLFNCKAIEGQELSSDYITRQVAISDFPHPHRIHFCSVKPLTTRTVCFPDSIFFK